MRMILSILFISIGIVLWCWGSFQFMAKRNLLWKIHALGAVDTIGTVFILLGALIQSLENWPHILLAAGAVIFWGTTFSFTIARLSDAQNERDAAE